MQWTKVKYALPIVGIILLSALFRFAYLDRIPSAISGDELLYVITAKSIWLTGHDMTGTWNPLSLLLFRYPPGEQQAELPYLLHLISSAPFPFALLLTKLPFALLSVGIVILLFAITQKLFGKTTAFFVGLVAAVNPWLVVMGRTGYEATPAMFFYLLSLYLLLRATGWKILWTIIPLILAFYSYIATKIIFIPFVAAGTCLAYHLHKKQYLKQYVVLCLLSVLVVAGFVILLKTSPSGSRIGDILLPNSPAIAQEVNAMRKASMQVGALSLVVNKYTVFGQVLLSKLFRVFSPTYLFVEGDQFFLPVRHSFFYAIDFFLLALGTIVLFAKKRLTAAVLLIFICIGTLPQLFHKNLGDFSIHLTLMFPFMVILIGAGIRETVQAASGRLRIAVLTVVLVLYGASVGNFAFMYFYQYPLIGSSDFPMRVLTKYLGFASQTNAPVTVYSNRGGDLFKKYLFYANALNRQTMPTISHIDTRSPFTFNTIRFTDCDTGIKTAASGMMIFDTTCGMHIEGSELSITKLLDGGKIYNIHNDAVCSRYSLNTYPQGIQISDFAVEQLSQKQFCETLITR